MSQPEETLYRRCRLCYHFVDRDPYNHGQWEHLEDGEQEFDHDALPSNSPAESLAWWRTQCPGLFVTFPDGKIGPNSRHFHRLGKIDTGEGCCRKQNRALAGTAVCSKRPRKPEETHMSLVEEVEKAEADLRILRTANTFDYPDLLKIQAVVDGFHPRGGGGSYLTGAGEVPPGAAVRIKQRLVAAVCDFIAAHQMKILCVAAQTVEDEFKALRDHLEQTPVSSDGDEAV